MVRYFRWVRKVDRLGSSGRFGMVWSKFWSWIQHSQWVIKVGMELLGQLKRRLLAFCLWPQLLLIYRYCPICKKYSTPICRGICQKRGRQSETTLTRCSSPNANTPTQVTLCRLFVWPKGRKYLLNHIQNAKLFSATLVLHSRPVSRSLTWQSFELAQPWSLRASFG